MMSTYCHAAFLLTIYFLYPFLVQVWLAGGTEQSARPTIPAISRAFVDGTYMVCFSDLWRCTEQVLAQISSPRITFYTRGPIWMLDATKEIVCPDVAYVRSHPGFFLPHCLPSSCISGGRRGLPLLALADISPVSPGNPPHHPQLPHKPAPLHRKVKSPGSAVSGECGRRKGQVSPPAPPLPPWKTTLPTLPLLPTQP